MQIDSNRAKTGDSRFVPFVWFVVKNSFFSVSAAPLREIIINLININLLSTYHQYIINLIQHYAFSIINYKAGAGGQSYDVTTAAASGNTNIGVSANNLYYFWVRSYKNTTSGKVYGDWVQTDPQTLSTTVTLARFAVAGKNAAYPYDPIREADATGNTSVKLELDDQSSHRLEVAFKPTSGYATLTSADFSLSENPATGEYTAAKDIAWATGQERATFTVTVQSEHALIAQPYEIEVMRVIPISLSITSFSQSVFPVEAAANTGIPDTVTITAELTGNTGSKQTITDGSVGDAGEVFSIGYDLTSPGSRVVEVTHNSSGAKGFYTVTAVGLTNLSVNKYPFKNTTQFVSSQSSTTPFEVEELIPNSETSVTINPSAAGLSSPTFSYRLNSNSSTDPFIAFPSNNTININPGINTIDVRVTSSGVPRDYTITLKRRPGNVDIVDYSSGDKTAYLEWSTTSDATHYDIAYNMSNNIQTATMFSNETGNSKNITTGLNEGQYFLWVRSKIGNDANAVLGEWSDSKPLVVGTEFSPTMLTDTTTNPRTRYITSGEYVIDNSMSVSGTLTIIAATGSGVTLKRSETNTGTFITVKGGATLTLGSPTVVGAGNLYIDGGAVNLNESESMLSSGSLIVVGSYDEQTIGNLNMYSNVTLQNNFITSGDSGGAVLIEGGTFTMYGGSIEWNQAAGGGGVYIYSSNVSSKFIMNGGNISYNVALYSTNGLGGGIVIYKGSGTGTASFEMNGGTISDNNGRSGGGGVHISNGGTMAMSGGYITRNRTNSTSSAGGIHQTTNNSLTKTGGTVTGNYGGGTGGANVDIRGTYL